MSKNAVAVFLDRDGTIIKDVGHIGDPGLVEFYPAAFEALRRLQERGYLLFIVTHQPGVAYGIITLEQVRAVNDHVVRGLADEGAAITETYVCPHSREEDCECVKPKPHHLLRAAETYGLDLSRSFMIGDHPHDVELGYNAGAEGIFVLTGHGRKHLGELIGSEPVVSDIGAAVERILGAQGD